MKAYKVKLKPGIWHPLKERHKQAACAPEPLLALTITLRGWYSLWPTQAQE